MAQACTQEAKTSFQWMREASTKAKYHSVKPEQKQAINWRKACPCMLSWSLSLKDKLFICRQCLIECIVALFLIFCTVHGFLFTDRKMRDLDILLFLISRIKGLFSSEKRVWIKIATLVSIMNGE